MFVRFIFSLLSVSALASARVRCPTNVTLDYNDPTNYCSEIALRTRNIRVGTLCLLRTEQIQPTQLAVGKVAVRCAIKQIERKNVTELQHYLKKQVVPTIVGPDYEFFITDRHHLSSAMFEATLNFTNPMKHRAVYACINADYTQYEDPKVFWDKMASNGNAYLKNEYGHSVNYTEIPQGLKQLRDDPYRTLSRWVRNSHGYIKCGSSSHHLLPQCQKGDAPFYLEFVWGNYFKKYLPVPQDKSKPPYIHPSLKDYVYQTNFQSQVDSLKDIFEMAMRFATDPSLAIDLPGYNQRPDLAAPIPVYIDKFGCDSKDEA